MSHPYVLAIRHGRSPANIKSSPAFGSINAHLDSRGVAQSLRLAERLQTIYEITPADTTVATSEHTSTLETADMAGFGVKVPYAVLNEVEDWGNIEGLREMIREGTVPPQAIAKAEAVLRNPPAETVWITHSLVIAGLCAVLKGHQDRFITPDFTEIRELRI